MGETQSVRYTAYLHGKWISWYGPSNLTIHWSYFFIRGILIIFTSAPLKRMIITRDLVSDLNIFVNVSIAQTIHVLMTKVDALSTWFDWVNSWGMLQVFVRIRALTWVWNIASSGEQLSWPVDRVNNFTKLKAYPTVSTFFADSWDLVSAWSTLVLFENALPQFSFYVQWAYSRSLGSWYSLVISDIPFSYFELLTVVGPTWRRDSLPDWK